MQAALSAWHGPLSRPRKLGMRVRQLCYHVLALRKHNLQNVVFYEDRFMSYTLISHTTHMPFMVGPRPHYIMRSVFGMSCYSTNSIAQRVKLIVQSSY